MREMKVCFIGVGSIAKRHIRNLVEISQKDSFDIQIDVVRRNVDISGLEERNFISRVYRYGEILPSDYDIIFITNPTDMHIDTLKTVEENAHAFFIEKPLTSVQRLDDIKKLDLMRQKIYYVACPLRYHPIIQYLKKEVPKLRVIDVSVICSSYLPEWRDGIDYRETYSAHKDLGGGVSIDLIHEWDYLQYIFGMPENVIYCAGKKSNLELDCDDIAIYIAEYADKFIELHLDYFGRKAIRQILLFTAEDTIRADLISGQICYLKSGQKITFDVQRDNYQQAELRYFLSLLERGDSANFIKDAYRTMQLTQGIVERG